MADDLIRTLKVDTTFAYKLGDQIKSQGNSGTIVFKGLLNGTIPIALKRYQKVDDKITRDIQQDLDILASPKNRHPNFIRFYGHTNDDNFSFLATELCECSIADIIDPRRKIQADEKTIYFKAIVASLSLKEILRQSSEAVSFLHNLGRIHRNLHPDNFLISCVDQHMEHFLVKLADFQLSKDIKNNPENTGTLAKDGWVAPESFEDKRKLTNKVDAFIMGCYYYYVLSGGKHPFGVGVVEQRGRIRNQNYEVYSPNNWDGSSDWKDNIKSTTAHEEEATWALEMIKDLIKYKEFERKSVEDVLLSSKYFQPETYQIYNHPEAKLPGLCVIVTQDLYHNPANDLCWEGSSGRKYLGVNIDANNLQMTFSSFGYHIISLKNLQAHEIVRYLSPNELLKLIDAQNQKPKGTSSFKDYASLVVCLLGHGSQGDFSGVDDFPVSLNTIQYDAFDDNACLDLSGKPKVFIILACQGDKTQQEIQRPQASLLVPTFSMATPTSTGARDEERTPPVFDFIRLMSTIEGYKAFVDPHKGSAFINSLCNALNYEYKELLVNEEEGKDKREKEEKKILKKSLGKRDLTQLFATFVTPLVGRTIQTPEFRSSLSKTIRFRRMHKKPLELLKPAYDGSEKEHFKEAREYKISQGWEAEKIIDQRS